MPNAVIISKGAKDWQIFQQENGVGSISFGGTYELMGNPDNKVWVRIVSERTQMAVVDWQEAEMNSDNSFSATINNIPAGGLYRLETCLFGEIAGIEWAVRGDFVFHIGVGDLYVITGQSNSAGYGKTPINDPPEIGVHLYKNSENWDIAAHPMNDSTRSVHEVNAEGANSGHSPYLSFAKTLKAHLNYPIGLIQTSLGGSPLSAWNPSESGELYHNMVQVVNNCTNGVGRIAGVLWYQGCSDCGEELSKTYFDRFLNMVNHMREDFHCKSLPIYTVQLNKVVAEPNKEQDLYWSVIREIQRVAARKIEQVFVVPTLDLGLSDGIHNNSAANMVLGERLAYLALSENYRKAVVGKAPDIETAEVISGTQIKLTFSNVYQSINTLGLPAKELQFEANDENGSLEITGYTAKENIIILNLAREIGGKAMVSFAAKFFPNPNIPFDMGSGLPLLAFLNFDVNRN